MNYEHLRREDAEIFSAMESELQRQRDHIELIASENFTSPAVMEAVGSHLTNKYAEGYPGKRFYGGCEYVDIVENIARERAEQLFGAEHANVQPHAGSQANVAVYLALCKPGDVIMGMDLACGGPPHPRVQGLHNRQVLRRAPLRRGPGDRAHRLRRDGAHGQGAPA